MPEARLAVDVTTVEAADGGRCALTRVRPTTNADRTPVVMVPGMFTGRRFWLSDRHVGLAAHLAGAGHPVAIVQRRGLSDSPPCDARAGLEEHVRYDLPAVAEVVSKDTGHARLFWIGHSFGGVMCALAAGAWLRPDTVAGLVLFASQFEHGKRMLDWPGNLLTRAIARLRGHFPARAAGLGPENEPAAAIDDASRWVATGRRSGLLREPLGHVTAPVLAISGAADRVDPTSGCKQLLGHVASRDVTFVRAGLADGYARDYDHPGVVISKPAQAEIWPGVTEWLAERSG